MLFYSLQIVLPDTRQATIYNTEICLHCTNSEGNFSLKEVYPIPGEYETQIRALRDNFQQ